MALKKGRMESRADPWRTWRIIACSTTASARAVPWYEHIAAPVRFCWAFWRANYLMLLFGEKQRPVWCLGPWEIKPCDSESFCLWHPERVSADHFLSLCTCGYCMTLCKHLNRTILDKKNSDISAEASLKFLGKLHCSLSWPQKSPCFCQKPVSFCVCVLDGLSIFVQVLSPGCIPTWLFTCNDVHWVWRSCCLFLLNCWLGSTREQITCLCSLNMYVCS